MRLVADEGVDKAIVDRLRSDGHEVHYVAEVAPVSRMTPFLRWPISSPVR